ncbi:histidinol-phosphatase [Hydrogenophaga flava]|uniref:histidinol-phosphatase n=1 Tax=Hydrogenophaga flava TaxID=65657 RepID=UPI000AF2EA2D|nr:histidinol-phosphatase [Hydrogenophaga flava]
MIIDSHTHTAYSKHATGSVDDVVRAAIAVGVSVLTITDHAPFVIDSVNRLLESELDAYLDDICRARNKYAGHIKILAGLEMDYMLGARRHAESLLSTLDLDFVVGSVHYLPIDGQRVNVWDLTRLNEAAVLEQFFLSLEESVCSGLFDAIGHPDSLLRSVPVSRWRELFIPLAPLFQRYDVSYELNASGPRKSSWDSSMKCEFNGRWSYPCRETLPELLSSGATFTVGSDAHTPADVGAGLNDMLDELVPIGLNCICYYEGRQRIEVAVGKPRQLSVQASA